MFIQYLNQKCDRLYPSAPLELKYDLEQRFEKKLNDINSFNNYINNIKEMITYFKDKNIKSKKRYRKYETLTTILKSIDTFVFIATTSSSITLSLTGVGSIVIPISTATACGLSIANKVLFKTIINKYNKKKKQYERDQNTIKSFNKLYRKSLQDNVIDKTQYESLCIVFTKYVDENKNESFFINMNLKRKLNIISNDEIIFQPRA